MRPPQNAGEDVDLHVLPVGGGHASMRPPQNAGEDLKKIGVTRTVGEELQ